MSTSRSWESKWTEPAGGPAVEPTDRRESSASLAGLIRLAGG